MKQQEPPNVIEAGSWASTQGQRALADLGAGVGAWRRDDLAIDPKAGRIGRFAHSAFTPFILLRRVTRDPALLRAYLRATLPVAALTLAVGGLSAWRVVERRAHDRPAASVPGKPPEPPQRPIPLPTAVQPPAVGKAPPPHPVPPRSRVALGAAPRNLPMDVVDRDDDPSDDSDPDSQADDAEDGTAEAVKAALSKGAVEVDGDKDGEDRISEALEGALPGKQGSSDSDDDDEHEAAWWSVVYGAMVMAEWCMLALTRDHQDQLSRRVALASAVPPDDPEEKARLRIDIPWLFRKLRRRMLGAMMFTCCLIPASLLSPFLGPILSKVFYSLLAGVWAVYWTGVFALGRSKLAWTHQLTGDPWFLRSDQLLGRYGGLTRWFGPRTYFRILGRVTRSVRPAALAFEQAYPEALGLGLSRMICGLPIFYAITRPVFAVAASHVLRPHLSGPTPPAETKTP